MSKSRYINYHRPGTLLRFDDGRLGLILYAFKASIFRPIQYRMLMESGGEESISSIKVVAVGRDA